MQVHTQHDDKDYFAILYIYSHLYAISSIVYHFWLTTINILRMTTD